MAQKRFGELPLVLEQVCNSAQLSAVTIQVQLCEWRQFLDFLSKAGNLPSIEEEDLPEPAKKMRRIKGKQSRDEEEMIAGASDLQDLASSQANGRAQNVDSEDEMPLVNMCVGKPQPDSNGQDGQSSEAQVCFLQAAQQALGQLEAKVASTQQAVEEQELQVKSYISDQEEATLKAVEAMRRSREADEVLTKIEIETSKREYLLTASHNKTEVIKDFHGKLEQEQAKLLDGKDEVFRALPPLPKDSKLLPRLASAAKVRIAHLESLMLELEQEADADDVAREPQEDEHAEYIQQGCTYMQERTRARDAANKAIEAMRTAQERCKDELEKLADQRLQLRLAQAQVLSLKQVLS